MTGYVLKSGEEKGIVMCMMPIMAHERALLTLRMIKLAAPEPIIQQENDTLPQAVSQTVDEITGSQIDFAAINPIGLLIRIDMGRQRICQRS